jgi:hypothetical protein
MGNNWGVLGSGFGSYGYLPAIVKAGYPVSVPERYLGKFKTRTDIFPLINKIRFCKTDSEIIKSSDFLVFARRPVDQNIFIQNNIEHLKSKFIFFEKPLSQSNQLSQKNLELLIRNKIRFRMGFLSSYSDWFLRLGSTLSSKRNKNIKISLEWHFSAQHFISNKTSWKGLITEGGGCFFFYGSHLIHAFSQLACWDLAKLQKKYSGLNTDREFDLSLSNQNWLANLSVNAHSESEPIFRITVLEENKTIFRYNAASIFEMPTSYEVIDPRSELIYDHIQSIEQKHEFSEDYKKYLKLEKKCLMSEETI